MTPDSPVGTEEDAFIRQCEADYVHAEITSVAHRARGSSALSHVVAVVELLHKHLEPNPLIGLDTEDGGYPHRTDLGERAGQFFMQRWHLPVRDGIAWYRACLSGTMIVPGKKASKTTEIQLPQLGEDPPWPHLAVEVESFWPDHEFWGKRPGGSRWHRMFPLAPVDISNGWEAIDFKSAREFLIREIHLDLLSRPVLLGSCHLLLPNPLYHSIDASVGMGRKSINFKVEPHNDHPIMELELTLWSERSWGATSVRRLALGAGLNVLSVPEGVERVAYAVCCKKRGILKRSSSAVFLEAMNLSLGLISGQRRIGTRKGVQIVPVVGDVQSIQIGTPRPVEALTRLATDETRRGKQKGWSAAAFQWFDGDSVGGAQAIQELIMSATTSVDLLDPYFGRRDLVQFALATTQHRLPVRVLTSHYFCKKCNDDELKVEHGEALQRTLESVRAQDPRLNIEVKVMPGEKSPVHDRFLIVDGTVWVLGASLNEFGSRGCLLMRLPESPGPEDPDSVAFSIAKNVFEKHWTSANDLHEEVAQRMASRASVPGPSLPTTTAKSGRHSKPTTIRRVFRLLREMWHA